MSQCLNSNCLKQSLSTHKFCQYCGSKLLLRERYRAIQQIGQGGFGKTFLAIDEDKPSKPYCVIKQFFPSVQGQASLDKASELFQQEAIRLEQLGKYPQIPELYAYFIHEDNRQYLIQEYVSGKNLQQQLEENGVFSEQKIIDILGNILPILSFIHGQDVIHRDIKPENIIGNDQDDRFFLVDFGASKISPSENGTVIGSAGYIAPEQATGRVTYASDLYSLGVTCLHLINRQVSDKLADILDKLTEFSIDNRYQSAEVVLEDLKRLGSVNQFSPSYNYQASSAQTVTISKKYQDLETFLKQKEWKKADQETSRLMLDQMNRSSSYLRIEDIVNFPCDDLKIIDTLWQKYSNQKFGFSSQQSVSQKLEIFKKFNPKNWQTIGKALGWYNDKGWIINHDSLVFSETASQGHFPFLAVWQGVWLGGFMEGQGDRFLKLMESFAKCR